MSVKTRESMKGIKLSGKIFGSGMEIPENITLWCNKNKRRYLETDIDDLFDVMCSNVRILEARDGFHIYNEDERELVYFTFGVDDKSANFGYFASVCWVTKTIGPDEASEFISDGCPMILM